MANQAATQYYSIFAERVASTLISSETYVPILNLVVPEYLSGTYELVVSSVVSSPDTNDSVHYQLTLTDGTTAEWTREAKDVTDVIPFTFVDMVEYLGSAVEPPRNITLSIRKEDVGASDLVVIAALLKLERKSELFILTGTGPTPP